jgi:hypothetical protein
MNENLRLELLGSVQLIASIILVLSWSFYSFEWWSVIFGILAVFFFGGFNLNCNPCFFRKNLGLLPVSSLVSSMDCGPPGDMSLKSTFFLFCGLNFNPQTQMEQRKIGNLLVDAKKGL